MSDRSERYPHLFIEPKIHSSVWIAPGAQVLGNVSLNADASVWFNSVLRGDVQSISVGERSNIQDLSMVHVTDGGNPTRVGADVTVGHGAILHACTIGNHVLVGMGSILLDGCEIEDWVLIGAGSLVPPGMRIPTRSKVLGRPARVIAELSESEITWIRNSSLHYVELAKSHRRSLFDSPLLDS